MFQKRGVQYNPQILNDVASTPNSPGNRSDTMSIDSIKKINVPKFGGSFKINK